MPRDSYLQFSKPQVYYCSRRIHGAQPTLGQSDLSETWHQFRRQGRGALVSLHRYRYNRKSQWSGKDYPWSIALINMTSKHSMRSQDTETLWETECFTIQIALCFICHWLSPTTYVSFHAYLPRFRESGSWEICYVRLKGLSLEATRRISCSISLVIRTIRSPCSGVRQPLIILV